MSYPYGHGVSERREEIIAIAFSEAREGDLSECPDCGEKPSIGWMLERAHPCGNDFDDEYHFSVCCPHWFTTVQTPRWCNVSVSSRCPTKILKAVVLDALGRASKEWNRLCLLHDKRTQEEVGKA